MSNAQYILWDFEIDSHEDDIRESIVKHIRESGCSVQAVASKTDKGPDILMNSSPIRIIEVKGFPSRIVTLGQSKGKIKSNGQRQVQAMLWVWDAIRELVEYSSKNAGCELAMGLPAAPFYIAYLNKLAGFREKLGIIVYLADKQGVCEFAPEEQLR